MEPILKLELWRQLLLLVPLLVVLLLAAITDLRERKIYNKLTYPALPIGLIVHTVALGWEGLFAGLTAALIMFVLGLLMMPVGIIKGGDIKLFVVVGGFVGGAGLFQVVFYSVFAGALLGIVMGLLNGYLWTLLKRIGSLIRGYFRMIAYRTSNLKPHLEPDERSKLPFAVAILMGGLLTLSDHIYGWPDLYNAYFRVLGM